MFPPVANNLILSSLSMLDFNQFFTSINIESSTKLFRSLTVPILNDLDIFSLSFLKIENSVLPPPTSTYKKVLLNSIFSRELPLEIVLASFKPVMSSIFKSVFFFTIDITSFEFLDSLSADVA